jgi:uncharacterized delta-60 repeat protein
MGMFSNSLMEAVTRIPTWGRMFFLPPRRRRDVRRKRLPSDRRLQIEGLEVRRLLTASPLAFSIPALLAQQTPAPHPTGLPAPITAQVIALANYSPYQIMDPGIPALEPLIQGLDQIESNILSNPAARPSYWGQPIAAGSGQYQLYLSDNGMLVSQWTILWGDGTTSQVSNQPWVVHSYAGNTSQYAITVTASSCNGPFTSGMGTPGALDTSFDSSGGPTANWASRGPHPDWATQNGTIGQQTTNFEGDSGFDQAAAVTLDADGNILVVGTTANQFGLVRYSDDPGQADDGNLDTSFGGAPSGSGLVTTAFAAGNAMADAVAVDPNTGAIVVAGVVAGANGDTELALARYNDADGSPDTTFGPAGDGTVTTDLGTGWTATSAVAVEGDSSIVVAGCLNGHFAVLHFESDGTRDTRFGALRNGVATVNFGGSDETPSAMTLDNDGDIVVAGTSTQAGTGQVFALARFTTNGRLATIYGGGAQLTTSFGGNAVATAITVAPDGDILVTGYAEVNGSTLFATACYFDGDPGGLLLDTNFGAGASENSGPASGLVTTSFGDGDDVATGVVVASDGTIVVSGSSLVDGNGNLDSVPHFALARYNADGTLDSSFGGAPSGSGEVTTDFSSLGFSTETAVGVMSDANGRLIVAGTASTSPLPPGEGQGGLTKRANY